MSLEPFFLGYGVLGVMFLLVLTGWVVPKWVIEEYRKREVFKDSVIERQTIALEKLSDCIEVNGK